REAGAHRSDHDREGPLRLTVRWTADRIFGRTSPAPSKIPRTFRGYGVCDGARRRCSVVFEEIRIQWKAGGETHAIVIDAAGRPSIEGEKMAKPGPPRRGQAWTQEEEDVIAAQLVSIE